MHHNFNFRDVLASLGQSGLAGRGRAARRRALDIRPPLHARSPGPHRRDRFPERTGRGAVLNQIRGHEYLALFGLVEEFILPFVLDHARPQLNGDDHRVRALLNFAGEEAKHIHLFRLFHRVHRALRNALRGDRPGRGDRRRSASPRPALGRARHPPDRVDDPEPLCRQRPGRRRPRSPVQEPPQASLDGGGAARQARHVDGRGAGGRPRRGRRSQAAIDGYLEIGAFLDDGLKTQARLNLDAFEAATGRRLSARERARSRKPAASGAALDLSRLRHGPPEVRGDPRRDFARRARPHRRRRAGFRLNTPN